MSISNPDRCEQDVFDHGKVVALIYGPRGHTIEDWILTVCAESEQKVDWSFMGGQAIVKCLGDSERVRATMRAMWDQLVDAYMVCPDNFSPKPERQYCRIQWYTDDGTLA